MEHTNLGGRVTDGIQDEDRDDEKGEDLVCEAGGVLDEAVQIHESGQEHVKGNPDSDPGVE
eukprot:scaffold24818_cov279-Cylindrotheca_fusiformis.AAC.1